MIVYFFIKFKTLSSLIEIKQVSMHLKLTVIVDHFE